LDWTDASAVLDIGCGNGKGLIQAESRSSGRIVGFDLSAGMLSAAARRGTGAYLMQADAFDVPLADGRIVALYARRSLKSAVSP
jgi:ubiquinone/menaquinone biosynthesis C-methylase UbiE